MAKWQTVLFLGRHMGNASGDWLDGGPNYGEVRSWFTDPIIYSMPVGSYEQYLPYQGVSFFGGSTSAHVRTIKLGKLRAVLSNSDQLQPVKTQPFLYPSTQFQPEFWNRSLIEQRWADFEKNWSETLGFAKSRSSLKVFNGGTWTSV